MKYYQNEYFEETIFDLYYEMSDENLLRNVAKNLLKK
jgi:hypothetical protein